MMAIFEAHHKRVRISPIPSTFISPLSVSLFAFWNFLAKLHSPQTFQCVFIGIVLVPPASHQATLLLWTRK